MNQYQKLVSGAWVDVQEEDLVDGDQYKLLFPNGGSEQGIWATYVAPPKIVHMQRLVELLPDDVLSELEDEKQQAGKSPNKRQAVRFMMNVTSNRRIQEGTELDTMLDDLVASTSLTAPEALVIKTTLLG